MAFNNTDLDKNFKSLEIEGFKFKKEIMGYSWTQLLQDRSERIIIGYGGYPDSYRIYTPILDIYFDEVERMINPLLDKHQIVNRYGDVTIQKGFVGLIEGIDFSIFDFEIKDGDSFNILADEVRKIINKGVLPFFEEFSTLQKVNEEIYKLNEEELSNFISGIVGIKVPLIKKLTGAEDFIDELKERKLFYSDEVFKYPQYFRDHDKVFNELFAEDLKAL